MTRHATTKTRILAVLAVLLVLGSRCLSASGQGAAGAVSAGIASEIEVLGNGDAFGRITFDLSDDQYVLLKSLVPNAHVLLRDLKSTRADAAFDESKTVCRYDDALTAVVMELHQIGAATNHGDGWWTYPVRDDGEFVNLGDDAQGRPSAFFVVDALDMDGLMLSGRGLVSLPAGASEVTWNEEGRTLAYRVADEGASMGEGRLSVHFDARDQLMSALYKMYGLGTDFAAQWAAKSIFTNTGEGVIRDLRVRYRVQGYSEWSMWEKHVELVPGQSVVSSYYPVLDRSIAELRCSTPANVLVEWEYSPSRDSAVESDSAGERIVILGVREFVFSDLDSSETRGDWFDLNTNAPLIAAWVAQDDPVVSEFASMANKLAGGQGAMYSDEAAISVLHACYELMVRNDFTYQGPVGFDYSNLEGFDNRMVQRIKFPRDVIKDRSGTCIELACLYASMAHAVGLKPFVVIVPGHAFCAVELPGGDILPVETTGVRGGLQESATAFDNALAFGQSILDEAEKDGTIITIDVRDLWTRGVANPELPALPDDILRSWDISIDGAGTPDRDVAVVPRSGFPARTRDSSSSHREQLTRLRERAGL